MSTGSLLPTRADAILLAKALDPQCQVTVQPEGVLVHSNQADLFLDLPGFQVVRLGHNAVKLSPLKAHIGLWEGRVALISGDYFYPF